MSSRSIRLTFSHSSFLPFTQWTLLWLNPSSSIILKRAGRQRDFGIEIDVAPLGVHVGDAEEAVIIVEADILRQRALVLAHVPLADALGVVAELLEEQRQA